MKFLKKIGSELNNVINLYKIIIAKIIYDGAFFSLLIIVEKTELAYWIPWLNIALLVLFLATLGNVKLKLKEGYEFLFEKGE